MQPGACFRLQQMLVAAGHQLLQAVAAEREVEAAVDAPAAVAQAAGVTAQAVLAGENIRRMQIRQRQAPAPVLRGQAAIRVVLVRAQAQPFRLRLHRRQLAVQADARRRRQGVGHLDLHVHAHRAQRVEQPLFAADQQNLPFHAELVFAHHPHAVLQRIRLQPRAALFQPVQARQLPAFDPGVGIDMVRLADADVVIDRRARKAVAQRRQQLRLLILPPLRQMAAAALEAPALVAVGKRQPFIIFNQRWRHALRRRRRGMQRARHPPLIPGAAVVRFRPVGGLRLHHLHVQPQFAGLMQHRQPVEQGEASAALRRQRQIETAAGALHAVQLQPPVELLVVGVAEQVVAGDGQRQRGGVEGEAEQLLRPLRFEQRRVRGAIREHQPVQAELAIVGGVAEVAAVGPEFFAAFVAPDQRLIDPVPDKAALQARMCVERAPVALKAAEAVAHRMGVFAQDQRALFLRQADPLADRPFGHRRERLILIHPRIHRADNVGGGSVGAAAFILHWAGRILAFHPAVQRVVVHAVAGLVAQRPDNDARVVAIALHHAGDALAHRRQPQRIVSQAVHRLHAVSLDIGFVHHVQPVAVAQPIPQRVVGIVRAAHRVEVVLLHQQDIVAHRRLVHHLAVARVMLVAVNAADQQRLPVELQQPAADFHLAKADVIGFHLDNHPFGREQGDGGAIQRGRFGAPQRRAFHRQAQRDAIVIGAAFVHDLAAERLGALGHPRAIAPQLNLHQQRAGPAGARRHHQFAAGKAVMQRGGDAHIAQVGGGFVQQADVAEDAAHAPHVLIFQIAAVAPTQHHHRQPVFTRPQPRAEIELRRQAAVLRIADPVAVAP
ncbi:Uncharacterised protein [Serratia marcescens]|nr:Uncharacterised protein [Serratia marcescens]